MTIIIEYRKLQGQSSSGGSSGSMLGQATFDSFDEVLTPDFASYAKLFLTQRFNNEAVVRWAVTDVTLFSVVGSRTLQVTVWLTPYKPLTPEVFLKETVRKSNVSAVKLVSPESLVEVDFGYIPSVLRQPGEFKSNKRYPDAHQSGEMHKRRLAVVVAAYRNHLLVVPVTSAPPSSFDKSSFQLEEDTLKNLSFYGRSGKDSYVLASMIQPVALSRVLPPEQLYRGSISRDTTYNLKLSRNEARLLRESLLHGTKLNTSYEQLKNKVTKLETATQTLEQQLNDLRNQIILRDKLLSEWGELLEVDVEICLKEQESSGGANS